MTGRDWARWLRWSVHLAALLLVTALAWAFWQQRLGPDSIGEITRRTGRYALVMLLLSLTVTPIATLGKFKRILPVRRTLGLYAFWFSLLHLLAFAGLDFAFDFKLILGTARQGNRVLAGLATLVVLLPLALTSTDAWRKRLGRHWKHLHRLAYLAAALDVLHYGLNFKEFRTAPVLATVALILLLIARIPAVSRRLRQA
ncbi:MAG: ferric reductase-like transmembrane domain-containing protein [Chloroflexia bacterium]|nr:ferric reductase-like transmembrane domain-containing protein [Chloroflexia bacterium]